MQEFVCFVDSEIFHNGSPEGSYANITQPTDRSSWSLCARLIAETSLYVPIGSRAAARAVTDLAHLDKVHLVCRKDPYSLIQGSHISM